jgi:hypothetical protein
MSRGTENGLATLPQLCYRPSHSIGQRIVPVRSIPTRRKPNHTAHLFFNLSFVSQIRNNPAHHGRIQALPGQDQKLVWIISVALG